jgi:beta-glucanase (GH16 family)
MKTNYFILIILIAQAFAFGSCSKSESELPNISIAETLSTPEGNAQQLKAVIAVTLSSVSDKQVSLILKTQDGTAKAGEDYIAVTDTVLVFQPGETSRNIAVRIINDLLFEDSETFYVSASNAKNGNLVKNRTTVTISNDDAFAPEINIASNIKVAEGNTTVTKAKITVTLSDALEVPVTLKWSTADGTAKAGDDYTAVSGSVMTFAPGEKTKYLEVQLVSDDVMEFNDYFLVNAEEVTNANLGNNQTKVTITNDDSFTPEIAADGPITPNSYQGMQLVWADEFDGNAVNQEWWTFETGGGGWGNNELEVYANSPINAFVYNGKLNIVATKTYGGYNSARMKTAGKKEFTYGRIDIRAKMPYGQGIWPALWMLGGNIGQVGWPTCGEIDIMEYLGHEVSKVYGTAHYNDGGHQYKGGSYVLTGGQGFNDQFHVFTILWQENLIEWYVDYHKFYEVAPPLVKFESFNLPQFFIFNVAVGGNWPGNPDATTVFPQTMQVDYVRVFQP